MVNLPMHGYQVKAVEYLANHDCCYLAIDMGLGKTRIVIEYIRKYCAREIPVLVLAPMRVAVKTWPDEILKWAPELSYAVLHGKNKEQEIQRKVDVYIMNYDGIKWLFDYCTKNGRAKFNRALLVLDESTMVKSAQSKRFKMLAKLRPVFSKVIAMSATPSPNGYQDLWSQYYLLDFGASLGATWTKFFNQYYRTLESHRVVPISTEKLKEIPQRCTKTTFRLDVNDYMQLPEFVHNDIMVDLPPELKEQYETLEKEFLIELSNEQAISAVNSAVLSSKLRQFCQGGFYLEDKTYAPIHELKLDALEQVFNGLNGEPTLVAVQFRFEIDLIRRRFGNSIPAIYGGVSAAESARIISEWNNGRIPVLVCHPGSLSHGVNLQSGGHYITWLALTWNFEQYTQFNGRLRRQGQKNRVILNRILIRGSVEERMAKQLKFKNINQQSLLDVLRDSTNELLAES